MNDLPVMNVDDLDIALPTASAIANAYFQAAEFLGLHCRILSVKHGVGVIRHRDRQLMIYDRWVGINDLTSTTLCANKHYASRCLAEAGLPVPAFTLASTARYPHREAVARVLVDAARARYPVCIKPVNGSHGAGVVPDIRSEEDLLSVIYHDACVGRSDTLIEAQASGRHYRVIVAYGEVIGCVERVAPRVTGDGDRNLARLVADYNHRRACYSLEPAIMGARQLFVLHRRYGLSAQDVVDNGIEVELDDRCNIKVGGNIYFVDVSAMSPTVIGNCVEAARLFDLEFAGLDLIGGNVLAPGGEGFMINEVNSQPAAHVPVPTLTREQRLVWPTRLLQRHFEL